MANLTKTSVIALCLLKEAGGSMPLSRLFAKVRTETECTYDAAVEALEALYERGQIGYDFNPTTGMPVVYAVEKPPPAPQDIEGLAELLAIAFGFFLQDGHRTVVRVSQLEEFMVPVRELCMNFETLRTLVARHGYTFTPVPDGFLVEKKLCKSS
jgi:hypothetical protein